MLPERDKYHLLVNNLPDGFAYHKIIIDDNGIPVDYVFLDVNNSFEEMTGLSRENLIGRKVTEVLPGIDKWWISTYGEVAITGESTRFEQYAGALRRWYEVTAYSDEPGFFATVFRDVTENKMAAQALQDSEARYRHLIETLQEGVWVINREDRIAFANRIMADMLGYTIEQLQGKYLFELMDEQDFKKTKTYLQRLAQGVKGQHESVLLHHDGRRVSVLLQCGPVFDKDGKCSGVIAAVQDITERKRVEHELRVSEEKYRSLIEKSTEMLYLHDLDGNILEVNKAACVQTGYSKEQLSKMNIFDLRPDKTDREILLRQWRKWAVGQPLIVESSHQRRDGTVYPVEISTGKVTIGDKTLILAIARDITERKQSEEALRKSEENLSITLNSIGDGVIATDKDGLIVRMNPVAEKLCGWSFKEAGGKPLTEVFRIINAETRESVSDPVKIVLEKGEVVGLANHTALISRDGTEYQIADSAAPIRNRDGRISGVVLVFSDVTEDYALRKKVKENELRWQFALEGAGDGVWDWNVQTNEVFYSRQWKRILGYEDHEISNTFSEWEKRIHPEDWEHCFANLEKHLRKETPVYRDEHRLLCKNGNYKWILERGKTIEWTEEGEPLRVIGTNSDITLRKQMEKELRESEERFRIVFHTSPDSLNLNRFSDGLYLEVNDSFLRIMGYEREEVIGRTSLELDIWVDPADRTRFQEALQSDGFVENMEAQFRRKDGTVRSGLMSAKTLLLGEEMCILSVTRDITERKRIDETLRALAESGDIAREDVFQFLVRQIAVSQNKRYALIAEIDMDNLNTAYTLAVWSDGTFIENFSFPLKGTPCQKVAQEGLCFFPRNVRSLFPKDRLLIELGVESYLGVPLRNTFGDITGVFAILDDRPMEESTQTFSLLKSFATRAVIEMERRNLEEKYRTLFTSMVQGVVYQNADGRIISANPAAEKILGLTLAQMQEVGYTEPGRRNLREDGTLFPAEEHPTMVALQTGQTVKDVVMGVFNPVLASYIWINVNAIPLFKPGKKKPYRVYATLEDITERKLAEQKLAGYTLELERLYRQLDEEMNKARQVHERTLPKLLPDVEGFSFAAHYQPAQKLGSDFYDVVLMGRKLVLYLSDVSGHGLDGAMLSVFVKHTIKGYLSFSPEDTIRPGNILRYLAEQFSQESYPEEYFICIFLAVLDLESMELTYSGAGFQETPLVSLGNGEKAKLAGKGLFITSYLPLTMLKIHEEESVYLTPGTTIFFNTDGLTEQGAPGAYYRDRLSNVFYENAHLPPQLIARAVLDDFRRFNNNSLQGKDDITFLVLQVDTDKKTKHRLELASTFCDLNRLREDVLALLSEYKEKNTILTCLFELAANAIEHGNRFDPEKTVTVEFAVMKEYIQVTIEDQGEGFNWREKMARPLELEGTEERGRGIAMVRICSDLLCYNEKGNRVLFIITTKTHKRR